MNKVIKITIDEHVVCAEKLLEEVIKQTERGFLTLMTGKKSRGGAQIKYSHIQIEEDHADDEAFADWVSAFMRAVDDHAELMECKCDEADQSSKLKH